MIAFGVVCAVHIVRANMQEVWAVLSINGQIEVSVTSMWYRASHITNKKDCDGPQTARNDGYHRG